MSTPIALKQTAGSSDSESAVAGRSAKEASPLEIVLRPLASLKLTVVLFTLSIFLVFASTLAQKELDIWEVIHGWYRVDERNLVIDEFPFLNVRELVVHVPFQIFFPDTFFSPQPQVSGGFYFPRGWVLGLFMAINLLAAHTVRFTAQARGGKLWAGIGLIALGCLTTWLAIDSGASRDGILGAAIIGWSTLWKLLMLLLAGVAAGGAALAVRLPSARIVERVSAAVAAVAAGGVLGYALYYGEAAEISPESMRILWQLIKGTVAGLVLLAGCQLVFNKRAGIVLLHGGIGLMFVYEIIVGKMHDEAQMPIFQGTRSNWTHDIRSYELAVTERAADGNDRVTVIPQSFVREGERIDLEKEKLPFDVRIAKFYKNSKLRQRNKDEQTPATHGFGLDFAVDEVKPVSGTDSGKNSDMTAAYVELVDKKDGKSLGTYLTGLEFWHFDFMTGMFKPQVHAVDGKEYVVELRYKRTYKPYVIEAVEVRKDDYVAGDKPRNYSSILHVVDKERNIDRQELVKMNNPMRFAGETFYQSGYNLVDGHAMTTIAVVRNDGWMLPYVSCMIVAVGLMSQFGQSLLRFLQRRNQAEELRKAADKVAAAGVRPKKSPKYALDPAVADPQLRKAASPWMVLGPVIGVGLLALTAIYAWRVPRAKDGEMDFYAFGKLPVAYESRVKPFDAMARGTLSFLSHRQSFKENLDDPNERSKPPVRWLLDVMTRNPKAEKYQVFRIDNLDALDELGLERNEHSRYSLEEVLSKHEKLSKQLKIAQEKKTALEPFEREIMKLNSRIQTYRLIEAAFFDPGLTMPSETEFNTNPEETKAKIVALKEKIDRVASLSKIMKDQNMEPPLSVPEGDAEWRTYTDENLALFLATTFNKEKTNPAAEKFHAILAAYERNDAAGFNAAVVAYRDHLEAHPPKEYDAPRRNVETYLNNADPFWWSSYFYLAAFLVSIVAWLGWANVLNRTATWMIGFTFVAHTIALIVRMYVSERPPVTNLYSSAVFIGWGAVVLGMIFEAVYKLGIGNIVAALTGFGSLQIAYLLTRQGDTIEALDAVLDTQFWLTTHVVCITLGYATTLLAGALGTLYVVLGVCTPRLTPAFGKDLARATYGALCFALFFSFVGTVLGGLWADDSWGRFWGWDPKENGALIIVLWNALVLHARWDGMAKDRGLAVLAVAGMITTSWSWFGVNQLGVGLHSYGFSQELLNTLFGLVVTSLAIVAVGSLPKQWWWSNQTSST